MTTRTLHNRPPFRAEHIGSFIRPAALYDKRLLFEAKQCSKEELKELEDDAIKAVVDMQRAAGIKTITDGELRRDIFYEGVFNNLEGISVLDRRMEHFKKYVPHAALQCDSGLEEAPTFFCNGPVKRTKAFYLEDFKYLKSLVAPEASLRVEIMNLYLNPLLDQDVKYIKITMPAPSWIHQSHGSQDTYDLSLPDEFFDAIGEAYRAEIAELYENGCRHIQIDNPSFCYFCDESMLSGMKAEGVDPEALLDTYIRAMNICTAGRPSDLTFGVHMCRGNYRGKRFAEGTYARIATKLFNDLDVDTFYLEYDGKYCGDFEPLVHLPQNKIAVLGIVTTKKPELETIEELEARINEAVDAMCKGDQGRSRQEALNQLCISTQCGFASEWRGNPVTEIDQYKKLELLVAAAKHIWGN
ncbi:hypothetical protein BDZ94DRAFT_1305300 [Collybia nuda]|uniref:Cobalamin-independent methionine synthase MetE C-terminal/archaeal domain-containing protein n=1 Tax=Collybia nuda TaxID=64659 RepID=A0A9P6CP63_9AGAR|nr:hypothetical protein BDZ94DRAFT_1305300 [Collybia nuda]